MSHFIVSWAFVLNLPLPTNFGLFFVFFLGDLLQPFQEDQPNTHFVVVVVTCSLSSFCPNLSLICTSPFVNERFYFQMSMISLDIKKIKILATKWMCAVFQWKGLSTLSQKEPLMLHEASALGRPPTSEVLEGGMCCWDSVTVSEFIDHHDCSCKCLWLSVSRKNFPLFEQQRLQKAPVRCLMHQQPLTLCWVKNLRRL